MSSHTRASRKGRYLGTYYISEQSITANPPPSKHQTQLQPFYWFQLSVIESCVLLSSIYFTQQFPRINRIINQFINELLIYPNIILLILLLLNQIIRNSIYFDKFLELVKFTLFQFYVILMFNGPLMNFYHGIIITSLVNIVYLYHDTIVYIYQHKLNPNSWNYILLSAIGILNIYQIWELVLNYTNWVQFNIGEHLLSYIFPLSVLIIVGVNICFSDEDEEEEEGYDYIDECKPLIQYHV